MDDDITRLRLSDSQDLLALAPYLLGYQPCEQLVFVVIASGRLVLTGAVAAEGVLHEEATRDSISTALDQFDDPMVLLACWSQDEDLAEQVLGRAEVWADPSRVLDSIHVGTRRWRSRWAMPDHAGGDVEELEGLPVVAQAIVAGLVRAPDRGHAVAVVEGPDPSSGLEDRLLDAEDRLHPLDWTHWEARALELQQAGLDAVQAAGSQRIPVEVQGDLLEWEALLAQAAVLAGDEVTRERLWMRLGRREAQPALDFWTQVVATTPEPWASGPLVMMAFSAWLAGQGALHVACLERLTRLGAQGSQVEVLEIANRCAVAPSRWEQVRAADVFGVPA
ncbi:hypothetical protein GCM10027030_32410 [Luteococcus sediminum]